MSLRRDIIWRCPAEFVANLKAGDTPKFDDMILLLKDKDGGYPTLHVFTWQGGDTLYVNGPLDTFSFEVFNPFAYELIAVVDYQ